MNIQGLIPAIATPLLGQSANNAAAATSSANSSSSSNGLSSGDLESTFLNLLVTELQNQDPTSPVDPTQMVSQMCSLNQLDQLISINQTLQNLASGTSATSGSSGTSTKSGTAGQPSSPAAGAPTTTPPAVSAASTPGTQQNPATSFGVPSNSGLMNLYSSFGLPATTTKSNYAGVR